MTGVGSEPRLCPARQQGTGLNSCSVFGKIAGKIAGTSASTAVLGHRAAAS